MSWKSFFSPSVQQVWGWLKVRLQISEEGSGANDQIVLTFMQDTRTRTLTKADFLLSLQEKTHFDLLDIAMERTRIRPD